MCDQTTNTTGQIKAGEVKAYAVTTPERIEALPDLPTTAEAGLPDVEVSVWHGLYVPAETPDEIVKAAYRGAGAALKDPAVVEEFAELGTAPVAGGSHAAGAHEYLAEQIELWKPIIEAAGVQPQ